MLSIVISYCYWYHLNIVMKFPGMYGKYSFVKWARAAKRWNVYVNKDLLSYRNIYIFTPKINCALYRWLRSNTDTKIFIFVEQWSNDYILWNRYSFFSATDVDQCEGIHDCSTEEKCVDRAGQYMCVNPCHKHYKVDPVTLECVGQSQLQSMKSHWINILLFISVIITR